MGQPVIVMAKRTPFGKYAGSLKHLEPEQLLAPLWSEIKKSHRAMMPYIEDVILGNVVGNGGNIARKSLLESGLDMTIPGVTLDRQCGSGLEAVIQACRMVQAGAGQCYIAGGVESTSRAPWKIKRPQSVYDTTLPQFYERAAFAPEGQDPSMIEAAENVAHVYHITREDQDAFALQSHQRTVAHAQDIQREKVPICIEGASFLQDDSVKPRLTARTLSRFKPLLESGTITVGNSCMKNDGAVLIIVMDECLARQLGYETGLQFIDAATKGVDPTILGIGPVPAVQRLLQRQNLTMQDIDAVELNEAFSAQVLASQRALDIPGDKLNQWGGALATGHPYGASGAALVTRLFNMKHVQRSIATMGIGGGMGNAVMFERWS